MTSNSAARDEWVETPRGRLFVRIWGAGLRDQTPVVLFHDSLGCIELWRGFPQQLCTALERPVIAYDRLGFGHSDAQHAPLTVDFIRDEATFAFPLLAQQLQLADFIALGHSVGSAMAVHCAASSRCRALITESGQSFVEDRTHCAIAAAKTEFRNPTQLERLTRYHGEKARWVLDAWTETWLSPEFQAWTLDDALAQVRCPALVIHGEHDEFGSPEHARRIASRVAGPVRLSIPECWHVPHREQPDTIVELIRAFLESVLLDSAAAS